ncbi:type IV secretory system conjugative DNA transfer family protein [Pectobacterium versatile]|uniref:hypothetical protein n=1 Tax=Pectobacterium versatile TaxID=2488639 RepID=UPI000D1BD2E9|nr:hypothetical protein [Pectobacterium versatile]AVT58170.1 mobilization protein [Pectobacterium versatile]
MILNKLAVSLSSIVNGSLAFIDVMQQHQLMMALLSGLTLPFFASMKNDDRQKASLWKKLIISFSLLCFLFGTMGPLLISVFQWLNNGRILTRTPILDWSILIIFTVAGFIFHIALRRTLTPELDKIKKRLIKKTSLERELRTDVRTVKSLLPETLHYEPLDYIDLNKGIFIGMNRDKQPMYLPLKDWQKQHADIIGTTGAGKGVATGILLYQSILADEGVFIMDPKDDEWATHLYRKACEDAGKPFALIDLRKPQYQLNLIEDITSDELEELFVAGFSLAEKGQESDFYRIDDRKAARMAAQFVSSHPSSTIRGIYNGEYEFKLVYRVMDPDTAEWVARMSGTILVDDEIRKAKTDAVLTETIDGERTIRQAERFFIDSNMILNLPDFVSFTFTTRTLPSASLISPIKVQKRELEIYSVSPDISASAASIKIALDFDEEEELPTVTATRPDLFFEEESKSAKPRSDDDETPSLLNF